MVAANSGTCARLIAATVVTNTVDWLPASIFNCRARDCDPRPDSPVKSPIHVTTCWQSHTTLSQYHCRHCQSGYHHHAGGRVNICVDCVTRPGQGSLVQIQTRSLISPTVTARSPSSSAVVSKSNAVDAEAVLPASSVTLTDTATLPSASAVTPPDTSTVQSPLLPASAFAVHLSAPPTSGQCDRYYRRIIVHPRKMSA